MIKSFLKLFYLFSFLIYIFFVISNYFSDENVSLIDKKVLKNNNLKIEQFNIPILKNNTENVIIYNVDGIIEKENKKRKIWELLN